MSAHPGLLLLHGAGDDGACWGPFVARLRRCEGLADLVVAAPTAPAHGGRRAAGGQSLAWPDLVAEATGHAQALAARTGGQIVVAGHSMGAMTAIGVSAHRPDLVVGTFLEDPPLQQALPDPGTPAPPAAPADLHEFVEWFADLQARPIEQVLAMARAEHPGWDAAEYEPWARAKHAVDVDAFRRPVVFVHGHSEWLIRDVPAPVVVAAGLPERGGMLAVEAAASLAGLPGWTVHRVAAGHDVRRDAPDRAVRLLADLIRSSGAAAAPSAGVAGRPG